MEYANFLTKFANRTDRIMTGNPTNCTGNSNEGAICATAFEGPSTSPIKKTIKR